MHPFHRWNTHTITEADSTSGNFLDATGNPFKLVHILHRIGTTTYREYNNSFEKDKALVRRFQKINMKESSVNEAIKILNGTKSYYESSSILYKTRH